MNLNFFLTLGVTLSLWTNPLNHELCPVTALFVWLLITGLLICVCNTLFFYSK